MTALDRIAFAQAAAAAVRADELGRLAGYAAANRYSNTYTSEGNNAVQAEILAQRNRDEAKRSFAASQQAAQAQKNREAELRVQEANIGRLMQGRATNQWEQAREYAAARAQYFGYGSTPTSPTSTQKPNAPQPTIQMQQARDTRTGSWSARVQTYTDHLQRTQPGSNPIYARNEAIAWIGPDPAAVTVKAAPVKPPLQVAEEARLAQQARDRETARLDEISRAMTAAKNPAAASAAAFAQQVAAFGNAPAVPPPPAISKPTYAKPIDVRDPIARTLETVAAREASAVAALREAIANGAVLASIVAKVQPKKNQPKKTKGSKSGSKRPISKPKK